MGTIETKIDSVLVVTIFNENRHGTIVDISGNANQNPHQECVEVYQITKQA